MKGLLIKDFYIMGRELKLFGLMIFVFALIPQMYMQVFAIAYASMLPITAIAYDEQSKWNHLAAMMPYRKKHLVMSKYIIGIIMTTGAMLLALVSQTVIAMVKGTEQREDLSFYFIMLGTALLLLSLNLPVIFKLGTEKGRMVYILFTVLVSGAVATTIGASSAGKVLSILQEIPSWVLPVGAMAIGIIGLLISVEVSTGIYRRKEL